MTTTQAQAASAAIQAASVFDVLEVLKDDPSGKQNMVRAANYSSEDKSGAGIRHELGESGRGKGQHVGSKILNRTMGLAWNAKGCRATGLLSIVDKTNRDNDRFSYRSLIVFDTLNPERDLNTIEVCDNFGPWRTITLKGLPHWPTLPANLHENFVLEFVECLVTGATIDIFVKKIDYMKKIAKKTESKSVKASDGSIYAYVPPTGTVERIVNVSDSSSIKRSVQREIKLARLSVQHPSPRLAMLYPKWVEWIKPVTVKSGKNAGNTKAGTGMDALKTSDLTLLPLYVAELARLKAEYEIRYAEVRPYEMGFIEQAREGNSKIGYSFPNFIEIDNYAIEIEINSTTRSEFHAYVAKKLASGEYEKRNEENTRGSWELTPAPKKVTV